MIYNDKHYILRCLIHAANIRHKINALSNRKSHQTGVFRSIFSALHTKSLPNRPFEQIWCEVPSFSGVIGGVARPPTPANPSQAMVMENFLLRVVPRPNPSELINALSNRKSPNNSLSPIWDYVDQFLEKKNMEGYESERNKI
ncbi:hypothetical protein ACQX4C_03995 [Corynebacterium diphtheriae]